MTREKLLKKYHKGQRDFKEADLNGANLRGANLWEVDLRGANLRGANLRGANLWESDLRGTDLRGANLRGADLRGVDLEGAELRGADLDRADLRGANLRGANLRGADLDRADLRGANLKGANYDDDDRPLIFFCNITGLQWSVGLFKHHIQIGCKKHSYDEWKNFSDEEIKKMDEGALEFKNQYLGMILGIWEQCNAVYGE